MKRALLFAMIIAASATLGAQTASSQKDAAKAPAASTMPMMHNMDMMDQCMASMAKALPAAEKNLADMKAALAQMKSDDPAAKRVAELNVQMWEAEVAHMKEMQAMHDKMMSNMPRMRRGPPKSQ